MADVAIGWLYAIRAAQLARRSKMSIHRLQSYTRDPLVVRDSEMRCLGAAVPATRNTAPSRKTSRRGERYRRRAKSPVRFALVADLARIPKTRKDTSRCCELL